MVIAVLLIVLGWAVVEATSPPDTSHSTVQPAVHDTVTVHR
ncbi:hypothetical protein [Streptomyces luteireticuli]